MSEGSKIARRQRSPNYPAISLREAIDKVRVIYSEQRKTAGSREDFARILGYNGLTGTSVKVVSALSKYGLLTGHGNNLRVSEIGEDLSVHRPGDVEYEEAVQLAADNPAFFKELNAAFPEGLPSEHTVRATLIKKGFADKAIQPALETYRDTQALIAESVIGSEEPVTHHKELQSNNHPSEPNVTPPSSFGNTTAAHNASFRIPISPDNDFILVTGQFPITEGEWNLFLAVINSMKPALVIQEE